MSPSHRKTTRETDGYDPATDTYHTRHSEDTDVSLVVEVVEAVSAVTGTHQMEMEQLYSVIDPDALESIIRGPGTDVQVVFTYEGCSVLVESDGRIVVDPGR